MAKQIQVERDGSVATVTLSRPRKLNALTRSMWHKLGEAVVTLSADNDVRCVVLRGSGNKAFSAGNDIGEFEKERASIPQARRYGADMKRTIDALQSCRHPMVAMINGVCVGRGARARRQLRHPHLRRVQPASARPSTSSVWSCPTRSSRAC